MTPREPDDVSRSSTDLFRERLDNMLNQRHALYRLAGLLDWPVFDEAFGALYCPDNGCPGKPMRLMVGLQYLKHCYGLSDEAVVSGWIENPYWQYFCGETYFQHEAPVDPSSLTRFRQRIGESGCEQIFQVTVAAGVKASIATTNKSNFVVGGMAVPGNPYDGHTLEEALAQVRRVTGSVIDEAFVDKGYRGHGEQTTTVYIAGQKRGIDTRRLKRSLKRRQAIEPVIGHLKSDGRLGRNFLKGTEGDQVKVLLSCAGHNLRLILNRLRLFCLEKRRAVLAWLRLWDDSYCLSSYPTPQRWPDMGFFRGD